MKTSIKLFRQGWSAIPAKIFMEMLQFDKIAMNSLNMSFMEKFPRKFLFLVPPPPSGISEMIFHFRNI